MEEGVDYQICDQSGDRVKVTGEGRNWTWEYFGQTGVVLGEDEYTNGLRVQLDSGEFVSFYSDELEPEKNWRQ